MASNNVEMQYQREENSMQAVPTQQASPKELEVSVA